MLAYQVNSQTGLTEGLSIGSSNLPVEWHLRSNVLYIELRAQLGTSDETIVAYILKVHSACLSIVERSAGGVNFVPGRNSC